MWTRSNAPWQRTIVWSRSRSRRAASSGMLRIFRTPDRSRLSNVASGGSPGRRESSIAAQLHGAEHLQRAEHVHEVLEPKGFALAFLAFDQIHWHFDDRLAAM